MSDVTDLLVTCELSDEPEFRELQQWFADEVKNAKLVQVNRSVAGHKACQAVVGIAALNYFDRDAFVAKVRTIKWSFPDGVRVFEHTEQSDVGFQELEWRETPPGVLHYGPKGGGLPLPFYGIR